MSWWTKTRDTMTGAAGASVAGSTGAALGGAVGYHNSPTSGKGDAGKLYAELEKAGLQWSNRGKDGWQNLSEAQTNQALGMYSGYDITGNDGAELYKLNLEARKEYFDQIHAQEEAQAEAMAMWQEMMAGMQGALKQAADAAAYVTPYAEVLKKAPGAVADARDETAQRQALRRGLMSTFSSTGGLGGGTDF